jgi:Tannase and feruloyl esterase
MTRRCFPDKATTGTAKAAFLGIATGSYGDSFDPNRELTFTRSECAELLLFFLAAPLFAQTPCADMARLPNVTAAIQTATHCRVSITLRPAADCEIKSEVWLPAGSVWNGKLLMEGGGGLVGSLNTEGMTHAVREGYASASTDTGHRLSRCSRNRRRGQSVDCGLLWPWPAPVLLGRLLNRWTAGTDVRAVRTC